MDQIQFLQNELRGRDRAIDMHLEEIRELRRELSSMRRERDNYRQALEAIRDHAPQDMAQRALDGEEAIHEYWRD